MLYTILDLETNGLIRGGVFPQILEVGYIQVTEELEIVRGGNFYFYKPEWDIENDAQAVHHLQRSFLAKHEKEFAANLVKLYTLTDRAGIISKNGNSFDIPIIKNFIQKYEPGLYITEARSFDMQAYYTPIFKEYWHKKYQEVTRKKGTLGELVEMCGFKDEQIKADFAKAFPECDRQEKHGALYDCYLTYLITKYAVEKNGYRLYEEG